MSDSEFLLILGVIVIIHLVLASPVLFFMFRRIEKVREAKLPKKHKQQIEMMNKHIWVVALLPIAGPIIGAALLKGLELGVPEKGFKVNDPGGRDSASDDGE